MSGFYIILCVVAGNLVYDTISDFSHSVTEKILKKKSKEKEGENL